MSPARVKSNRAVHKVFSNVSCARNDVARGIFTYLSLKSDVFSNDPSLKLATVLYNNAAFFRPHKQSSAPKPAHSLVSRIDSAKDLYIIKADNTNPIEYHTITVYYVYVSGCVFVTPIQGTV